MAVKTPRDYILEEFLDRKSRNPVYSLRAFARDTGCSIGYISEVLSGKRPVTVKAAEKIAGALNILPLRRRLLLSSIAGGLAGKKTSKQEIRKDLIADDQFRLIADWYHFGILSLARLHDARANAAWVARKMGISENEAGNAVVRLKRLGLVATKNGRLIRTSGPITTTIDIPSYALKRSHQQTLEQAIKSLHDVPVNLREVSSTTVATTAEKILQAKAMMREFSHTLCDFLEDGPKTDVYNVNFQLVPITPVQADK